MARGAGQDRLRPRRGPEACEADAARPQKVGSHMASKVFVGNLDFHTSKDELQELFGQAGSILDVFLPTDRATGRPRGFAFVEFATEEEATAAIERFEGQELNGRALRVNAASDRPPGGGRPSFGGGGDSGGGSGFGPSKPKFGGGGKPKGSRRNIRARKRGL